jgi:ABC-type transport system involved in multi-copper enzyme maturation permease subunit
MLHFFFFEIKYWLRSAMLWVFTAIVALLVFAAMSTDQVTVGGSIGNTFRNAPFVVQQFYSIMWFITLLMVTAFVNSAASREFAYNMHQIVFSTPIRKSDFLVGRFLGAVVISTIPLLGISIGALLAPIAPWADAERFGPVVWSAHWQSVLIFALPNTFFIAAIIFTIAVLTRSTVVSFLGGLLLLVADAVADALKSDMKNETLSAMLDPFGNDAFSHMTKYWTVAERNSHAIGLTGILLWNRLLWLAVGVLIFAFAYWRFSFSERAVRASNRKPVEDEPAVLEFQPLILAGFSRSFGPTARWKQLLGSIGTEYGRLLKTVTFIVVTCAALINCMVTLIFGSTSFYGLTSRPVTYQMLDIVTSTLYGFLIAMITFFAGVLIWEERDARIDEVNDALPIPEWPGYLAKFLALMTALASIQALVIVVAVCVQAAHHYTRFQLGLYVENMLGQDLLSFAFLAVLAFFIHILSPNKYVGYFAFIGVIVANAFVWRPLHVATRMLRLGSLPQMTYSDFFGYQPWIKSWLWFALYWSFFYLMVATVSILLLQRGRDTRWKARLADARTRFHGTLKLVGVLAAAGFVAVGTWVFYNTEILNHVDSENDKLTRQADYEKLYKKYEHQPEPRVLDVKYNIAIYPATREMAMRGEEQVTNLTSQPLTAVHFTLDRNFTTGIDFPGSQLLQDDRERGYRIYKLTTPLAPGEVRTVKFEVETHPRGFENLQALIVPRAGVFFRPGYRLLFARRPFVDQGPMGECANQERGPGKAMPEGAFQFRESCFHGFDSYPRNPTAERRIWRITAVLPARFDRKFRPLV